VAEVITCNFEFSVVEISELKLGWVTAKEDNGITITIAIIANLIWEFTHQFNQYY